MTLAANGPEKEANTMIRKLMTLTAVVSLVVLSACRSSTGLKTEGAKSQSAGNPGPKPPQQFDKVCLEDLRAVEITGPGEGSIVYGGDTQKGRWEARASCRHITTEPEEAPDDGRQC